MTFNLSGTFVSAYFFASSYVLISGNSNASLTVTADGYSAKSYLQKGYPLPPSSFLKDYQHLLKDICLEPQTRLLNDKSYTHNRKTPISIYENQNMSKSGKSSAIVVFDDSQNNGDMITLGKRGKKYMNQVKESGNMGTGGGTI